MEYAGPVHTPRIGERVAGRTEDTRNIQADIDRIAVVRVEHNEAACGLGVPRPGRGGGFAARG
ncbi:MAG: hypothetical protein ACRD29_10500, partial [Acidimicrobiales bacterium]